MLEVVNPRGLLALPVPRPEQDLPAAEQQLRMIWWTSAEVYRHVAGVTWESYRSMHKPTVEQLFQVSQALTELSYQLSGCVASVSCLRARMMPHREAQ